MSYGAQAAKIQTFLLVAVERGVLFFFFPFFIAIASAQTQRPPTFVNIQELVPTIQVQMLYATRENFTQNIVPGYRANICYLSRAAAQKIKAIQESLVPHGESLLMRDCYRPQKAVRAFMQWARDGRDSPNDFYDFHRTPKRNLPALGYISPYSYHPSGSTVDLSLGAWDTRGNFIEYDMGSPLDYLGPISNHRPPAEFLLRLTPAQFANRAKLRTLMFGAGFHTISTEWWHYTLNDEPYAGTYFDFDIE